MLGDKPQRKLHPNMRIVWLVGGLVTAAMVTAGSAGVVLVVGAVRERDPAWGLVPVVGTVALVLAVAWSLASWQRWYWDVTPLALTLHRGVVTHRAVALPFFRIQHIDTNRGPLDQLFGMTSFTVHTASVSARLPGIDADEAVALRADLLERAAAAAREVGASEGSIDAV